MKVLTLLLAAGAALLAADFSGVKSVYILPMAGGLDQYLAVRLASDGAFQVVTDPSKADAIFTERIGSGFEETLADLYAPKKPADSKLENSAPSHTVSSLSGGRGSLFLVDRNSRVVLWSTYAQPKSRSASDLNQLANKIVAELDKSRKTK